MSPASESVPNPHWDDLVAAFGLPDPSAPGRIPDVEFLFLLFTNRCGSNFVAQALSSTGRFNEAGEFFNSATILEHARARGLRSTQEYLSFLVGLVGQDGRLTAKLAYENVEVLVRSGIMSRILARSRFIFIERQDQLGQAISRVIAWQNLQWTTEHAKIRDDEHLVYDRGWIEEEMRQIQQGNAHLISFMRRSRIVPLHFAYEQFVQHPQQHIDVVADALGLSGLTVDPDRIRIRRQSGRINAEWRTRFEGGA